MDIPFWSMIPAITEPGKERENVSVIARSCAGLGAAIPTALAFPLTKLLGGGNERLGFQYLALGIAVVFILAISITVSNVSEHKEVKMEKSQSIKEMLMSLIRNDQALVVVIGIIVFNASLYLTQSLAIYFFKYDIGNEDLFGVFGIVGGATQILSMMMLPVLRKKIACKKILMMAISITIVGYTYLFTLGSLNVTNIIILCSAAIIIFIGFGLATVLTTIFLADSIDYGEWKHHQRNESVVFSLQTFVVKLASAISGLIGGVALDLVGIKEEAAKQSQSTLTGLRFFMIIIPMIGLIASIIYFYKKYKLDENTLRIISEDLQKRKIVSNMED
jgi:melibiose permease